MRYSLSGYTAKRTSANGGHKKVFLLVYDLKLETVEIYYCAVQNESYEYVEKRVDCKSVVSTVKFFDSC